MPYSIAGHRKIMFSLIKREFKIFTDQHMRILSSLNSL